MLHISRLRLDAATVGVQPVAQGVQFADEVVDFARGICGYAPQEAAQVANGSLNFRFRWLAGYNEPAFDRRPRPLPGRPFRPPLWRSRPLLARPNRRAADSVALGIWMHSISGSQLPAKPSGLRRRRKR